MAVTVADINKLRKMTGAGMMDCKKALVQADGDFQGAIDALRKSGAAKAAKRADRDAAEGLAIAKTNAEGTNGILLSLNCETDFVAKNADFNAMANKIIDAALANGATTVEEVNALEYEGGVTIGDKIAESNGTIGEKIEIAEFFVLNAETVVGYNHPGNQVATLVALNQGGELNEVGRDVAMQIAAMAPVSVDENNVPQDVKDRELAIGREQAIAEGKPENIIDKIAEGKLNKFYKENTLLHQAFIKDNKKSVSQYLKEKDAGLTVTDFKRIALN